MMKKIFSIALLCSVTLFTACSKSGGGEPEPPLPPPAQRPIFLKSWSVDVLPSQANNTNVKLMPLVRLRFDAPVDRGTVAAGVVLKDVRSGTNVGVSVNYETGDSILSVQPSSALTSISRYTLTTNTSLKSSGGGPLTTSTVINLLTQIDSTRKFPLITDEQLLDKVQQQTFKYFWDFAHPVSGLARERSNGDNNTVATGGSGFGILAIVTGISRQFITRAEGLARMQKIVDFLKNKAV
ncbi:MAG: beta-glucosidase, partial [Chitinophagaceae bacterium]